MKAQKIKRDELPLCITPRDVAKIMGINVTAAYGLARRTDFPSLRVGVRIVIPRDAFLSWLDRQALQKTAQG